MTYERKTLAELEKKYADVMNCKAVTSSIEAYWTSSYLSFGDVPAVDEDDLIRRVEEYAPDMRELWKTIFEEKAQ